MMFMDIDENLEKEMDTGPITVQSNIEELFINWDEIKANDKLTNITFPYKPFVINVIMNTVANLEAYKEISMFIRRCMFDKEKVVLSCPTNKREVVEELILQILEPEQNDRKRPANSDQEEIPAKLQKK